MFGDRRGSYTILMALFMVMLLAMSALVIDYGYAQLGRSQLQNAADAAAHAGTHQLDGTPEGIYEAYRVAALVAAANPVLGQAPETEPGDGAFLEIEVGYWHNGLGAFFPSHDPALADAVRAVGRSREVGFVLPLVPGPDSFRPGAAAVAGREVQGAGSVSCYLPLAVSECLFDEYGAAEIQLHDLVLNPPGVDSVGWARIGESPNASWTRDQLSLCEDGEARIGDPLHLQNGVVTSALTELARVIEASFTTWDASVWGEIPEQMEASAIANWKYGNTLEGALPLFDDPTFCQGGGQFNGVKTLSGFAWATIYDVRSHGPASERTLKLRIDTTRAHEVGDSGGGPDRGLTHVRPVLRQ